MNKEDLKFGMLVEYRNGYKRMVMPYGLVDTVGYMCKLLSEYTHNLVDKDNRKDLDIVKVYDVYEDSFDFAGKERELLWERKEVKLLNLERDILKYMSEAYVSIKRDIYGNLYLLNKEPQTVHYIYPFNAIFKFIENTQEYTIKELLSNC